FLIDGKEVRINIGITVEGVAPQSGSPIWLQYGHRNIAKTTLGCGGYTTDRIRGVVILKRGLQADGGWKLAANKDDLTDYKEELNDEIEDRIRWILEKAEQLAQDVENEQLATELESHLNEAISNAK